MLFDIVNGHVIMNPNSLAMPEFKAIWDRDKTKVKELATKELSYIVFLCDESVKNPYHQYRLSERIKVLKTDFMHNLKWQPDKLIQAAIDKFKTASESTTSRLLIAAKNATEKLADYFNKVNFSEVTKEGKPIYSSRELASNIKEVGGIVKSLDILEKQVKKEQLESNTVRGGSEVGYYEMPREDFDYGN